MNKYSTFWIMSIFVIFSYFFSMVIAQSTSVSLEPTLIEVPFLELEHAEIVVAVNLTLNNISELKKFTVILTFDGTMLEFYTTHAGDWGYGGSRSTNPTYGSVTMSGEVLDGREMSGSGNFFSFVFKVLDVGSSEISLQYVYLEDKSGSVISYSMENENVTVEILPIEIWVDGVYLELMQDYEVLLEDFQTLNASYQALLSDYDSLNLTYEQLDSDCNSLRKDYNEQKTDYNNLIIDCSGLMQDYEVLLEDFQTLNASYQALLSDYDSLNYNNTLLETYNDNLQAEKSELMSDYESLQSTYNSISNEYNKVSEELLNKKDELSTITILMYVFVITTLVLVVSVAYWVKNVKKAKNKTN